MRRTLTAVTFLVILCILPARAQDKVVSARAGLVIGVEGEVVYHCHEKGGMRCKDYFQARKSIECLSLGCDPEQ